MLRQSFIHFNGVTAKGEIDLWQQGITCWDDAVMAPRLIRRHLVKEAAESTRRLAARDSAFFHNALPSSQRWRMYPDFMSRAAFLDIETTGLSPDSAITTMVGILDNDGFTAYVRGDNLDELVSALDQYEVLVTFNGASFDLPFLVREFPEIRDRLARLAHIDLRYPLKQAGFTGGLKKIERRTGLGRKSSLSNLGGADAVTLWKMAQEGEPDALSTLIRYNAEDVTSLPKLATFVFDELSGDLPIKAPLCPRMDEYSTEQLPYDESLVRYLMRGRR